MCAAAVQIIARALVLDHVREAVVADVLAVREDVQPRVRLVAQEAVREHVLAVVPVAAQVDVLEVARVHVLMHVLVVREDAWAIVLEHALERVQGLVQHRALDGTIINHGF